MSLTELLDLETPPDTFTGDSCSRSLPFVFGGQVAAQSLAAAYRTRAPGAGPLTAHLLHERRRSNPPLIFTVSRPRMAGPSSPVRSWPPRAGPIFTALLSFTVDRPGSSTREAGRASGTRSCSLPTRPAGWSLTGMRFRTGGRGRWPWMCVSSRNHRTSCESRRGRRNQQIWMRAEAR